MDTIAQLAGIAAIAAGTFVVVRIGEAIRTWILARAFRELRKKP